MSRRRWLPILLLVGGILAFGLFMGGRFLAPSQAERGRMLRARSGVVMVARAHKEPAWKETLDGFIKYAKELLSLGTSAAGLWMLLRKRRKTGG